MNLLDDTAVDAAKSALPARAGGAAVQRRTSRQLQNWRTRTGNWGRLMAAAQGGQADAYEQLLRELDVWLRRYYARRLPRGAAEDAKQDALLAVHAARDAYSPSRPFGPWIAAIARYKWIDMIRDASRFATLSLRDEIAIENRGEPAIDALVVNDLLKRLKPAQARVIRLVKLQGVSVDDASHATGQSAALVKVNVHRGMKKLAALAARDPTVTATSADSSTSRAATA